jgi:D-methionine transport system permease protein
LRWVNLPLGLYVNISRSLRFLVRLIVLIPVARFMVGTSLGVTAAIVPLTFGTPPFFGRLVETSLREVEKGKVEVAEAMGATHGEIVRKVLLPEALPALLAGVTLTRVMFVDTRRWPERSAPAASARSPSRTATSGATPS